MSLLLKDCRYVVTQNGGRQVLENKDILVEGTEIVSIGKKLRGDEVLDCSDSLVMPGLINTHTHISMTKLRGVADVLRLTGVVVVALLDQAPQAVEVVDLGIVRCRVPLQQVEDHAAGHLEA